MFTVSLVSSSKITGADVEGQGCQPSVTEYDEDHRFEDQEYVTSFIKSFRNNPRRYKVQPSSKFFLLKYPFYCTKIAYHVGLNANSGGRRTPANDQEKWTFGTG